MSWPCRADAFAMRQGCPLVGAHHADLDAGAPYLELIWRVIPMGSSVPLRRKSELTPMGYRQESSLDGFTRDANPKPVTLLGDQ